MGFMTVVIDILIPRFKEAFTLDYYHAIFLQLVFFSAYFLGSLLYFIISATQGDLIAKIGHKKRCCDWSSGLSGWQRHLLACCQLLFLPDVSGGAVPAASAASPHSFDSFSGHL